MSMLHKPIRSVFLDVGWTLLYPPSGHWHLTPLIMERVSPAHQSHYGWDALYKAVDDAQYKLSDDHLVRDEAHEYRQFYDFYSVLFAALPKLEILPEELEKFAKDKVYNDAIYTFFPDTRKTVETLKQRGYKLGIISDTWPSLRRMLKNFGIYDCFDAITLSCDLGIFKPHPDMYRHAINGLGLPAEETLFVDDSLANVLAAAERGIQPVLITKSPATQPDDRVTNLSEISDLLTILE